MSIRLPDPRPLLIVLIAAVLVVLYSCAGEREILVERVPVKVIHVDSSYRGGDKVYKITYEDADRIKYLEIWPYLHAWVGLTFIYLKHR